METGIKQTATVPEMALLLGISVDSLNQRRSRDPGNYPPFIKLGSRVLHPLHGPHGFETWLANQVRNGGQANG